MQKVVVNCETGEELYVGLTHQEAANYEARQQTVSDEQQDMQRAEQERNQRITVLRSDPHFQAFKPDVQRTLLAVVGAVSANGL